MPKSAFPRMFTDEGFCERTQIPDHVRTKKHVLLAHMDAQGDAVSEEDATTTADRPTGPFRWLYGFRPVRESTFRDMNLFQDDDGRACVFYSGEENQTMHVVRLNREHTAPDGPPVEGRTGRASSSARRARRPRRSSPAVAIVFSPPEPGAGRPTPPTSRSPSVRSALIGRLGTRASAGARTTFGSQAAFVLPVLGHRGAFMRLRVV